MEHRPYLTVEEIADLLNMDPRTIRRLIRDRLLPAHRIRKEYRVARSDFDEYMRKTRIDKGDLVEV